jgi:Tfp pilus assembly protein PilW
MTLVELLAAIAISLLIIGAVHTVFLSGIRAYQRIGIENELRSEADYAVAMVMNKLYEFAPDGIDTDAAKSNHHQLTFVNDQEPTIDVGTGIIAPKTTAPTELTIELQNGALAINGKAVSSSRLLLDDQSQLSFRCLRQEGMICRSGVITIELSVKDPNHADPDSWLYIRPFTLKTEFGF